MTIEKLWARRSSDDRRFRAKISVIESRMSIAFATDPRRGHASAFRIAIDEASYAILADAMMRANSAAAIKAFGKALSKGSRKKEVYWSAP